MSSTTEVKVNQTSKETTSQFIFWSVKTRQGNMQQNLHGKAHQLVSSAINDAGNRRLALVNGETGWESAKQRPD